MKEKARDRSAMLPTSPRIATGASHESGSRCLPARRSSRSIASIATSRIFLLPVRLRCLDGWGSVLADPLIFGVGRRAVRHLDYDATAECGDETGDLVE